MKSGTKLLLNVNSLNRILCISSQIWSFLDKYKNNFWPICTIKLTVYENNAKNQYFLLKTFNNFLTGLGLFIIVYLRPLLISSPMAIIVNVPAFFCPLWPYYDFREFLKILIVKMKISQFYHNLYHWVLLIYIELHLWPNNHSWKMRFNLTSTTKINVTLSYAIPNKEIICIFFMQFFYLENIPLWLVAKYIINSKISILETTSYREKLLIPITQGIRTVLFIFR